MFSKQFKKQLLKQYDSRCTITSERYEERYLQIDHRIPYEIAGDEIGDERTPEKFMLLSGSAQRQKSWSCEHCENFQEHHRVETCQSSYWASPETYTHIAMESIRQVDILWHGEEIEEYERIEQQSRLNQQSIQEYIKAHLRKKR